MSPDIVDDRLEILAFGVCNTDGIEGLTWVEVDQCQVCKNKYDHQGFHQVWYQGIVKATVFGVLEDLAFKISEVSDQN